MRGRGQRPSSAEAWLEAEVQGRSLAAQGPRGRGSPLGPSRALAGGGGGGVGGSRAANGRAPLEQLQRAGARPRRRRGGGARRSCGRGRAGPQTVAAGPWRRRPLLCVAACFSSCWWRRRRCSRGRRVSGGRVAVGRASRARPLARFSSFSNMARGRGRRWRRRAGRAFLTRQAPREPGRGGEAGRGRCRARVAEHRAEAGPLGLPGAAAGEPAEVCGCPRGCEAGGDRGPLIPLPKCSPA